MTATEELRRMLDERGVDWDYGITGATTTRFNVNGIDLTFTPMRDGLVCSTIFTPEKAIAATLGSEDTYTREDVEGAFVSGYSLGLDMFDSSKPDGEKGWNQNEHDMDDEMAELGWVRDRGTCHVECFDDGVDEGLDGLPIFTAHTWYLSCGHTCEESERPNYCPTCGAKVVDE